MSILSRLRVRTKLVLLLGFAIMAVLSTGGVSAVIIHARMEADRVDKLRAVVESVMGTAGALNKQISPEGLTHEQAMARLRDLIHAIRFDDGDGYISVQSRNGITLIHGVSPEREGKTSSASGTDGRLISDLIADAIRDKPAGMVAYMFPKPGRVEPQRKVAYVSRFVPWDVVFLAGAYTDDLDASFHASMATLASVGGAILLLTILVAWLINRDITESLGHLRSVMNRLAAGELSIAISGQERGDEVGDMARTVRVFQDAMVKAGQLDAEQQRQRERADAEKQSALVKMAETIETETRLAMDQISARTTALADAAGAMTSSAARTGVSAESAATAAGQALATAETVASAAEELATSIREISAQVTQSTAVVGRAVAAGDETRQTIEALNEQVARIGAVADMISEIAAKTNLLALNATIEAARAGDAGKGFAVVASEVKALANQTARSTEEITRHIGEVRGATAASVAAVARIEETISEMNAIASSIAAAVEQQGAATAEIARNVSETAKAANEITGRTGEVSSEARETGQRAEAVSENTGALNIAVGELKRSVIRVVRTSTAEVDRRASKRYLVNMPCRVALGSGTHAATVADLSDGGASIQGLPQFSAGTVGTLTMDGVPSALKFVVSAYEDGRLHARFDLEPAVQAAFRGTAERLGRRIAA
jgi:methyl-accepting chemotaxis protein